ncbi:MAG: ABC transporter permease subunit [Deltaproteobacteria bacterium]|nr:ABC transporter permease subunit [Deltaproteobacteria bacterium]
MRSAWVVMKRELASFFVSPLAYVVLTSWLIFTGVTFWILTEFYARNAVTSGADTPLSGFFGGSALFFIPLLVFVPVLTMRLVAAERQSGTLEGLMTAPISEGSIIWGKYGGALVMWGVLWAPTIIYAWIISQHGNVDWGAVASSYFGVFCLGAYFMAIGLLMSTIAPTQIIAAVLSFVALGVLFTVGIGEFVLDGTLREVCAYLSMWGHMHRFAKGVVDSRYLVFDFSVALLAVGLSIAVLKAGRHA